ncbi:hypothetical protein ElyMa_004776100 [Elysia marginata]|uniref:Uncharacterized protein n=1 Tax=Elysia marginata TaxID=1093978 RepID=A0AAV4II29_9GAST|nr:hypothetical protein ElyMa_004776100 [Elysia marginata]
MEGDKIQTGGRQERVWRETRDRLEGDKSQSGGRQEIDWRETRGSREGDKRQAEGRQETFPDVNITTRTASHEFIGTPWLDLFIGCDFCVTVPVFSYQWRSACVENQARLTGLSCRSRADVVSTVQTGPGRCTVVWRARVKTHWHRPGTWSCMLEKDGEGRGSATGSRQPGVGAGRQRMPAVTKGPKY